MTADPDEIPLGGGRVTTGVVRVGDTVRRPRTANSDFVQRLLRHLAGRGFEGAPRPFGTDGRGRDVVGYIEGAVPADLAFHDDATLRQAAALIRRFHDLGAELVATPAAEAVGVEVVCHNDLSPCNFVFRVGAPVAIIDFATAAPGSRAFDLGYAAWLWLDLGAPEIAAVEQARRLGLFLDAYGMGDRDRLVAAVLERQAILASKHEPVAMAIWARDCLAWTRGYEDVLRGL